jgi:hypothetical protein
MHQGRRVARSQPWSRWSGRSMPTITNPWGSICSVRWSRCTSLVCLSFSWLLALGLRAMLLSWSLEWSLLPTIQWSPILFPCVLAPSSAAWIGVLVWHLCRFLVHARRISWDSWHVHWDPCKNLPILTEKFDECAYLCDRQSVGHEDCICWISRWTWCAVVSFFRSNSISGVVYCDIKRTEWSIVAAISVNS